jgi:predicted DNA-binding transcriptional regulator AlpA
MTLPDVAGSAACEPEAAREGRPGADRLISVADIRVLFKLGRTAAYELTRRPGFPAAVQVSSRCLRWQGRSGLAGTKSSTTPVSAVADSDRAAVTRRGAVP